MKFAIETDERIFYYLEEPSNSLFSVDGIEISDKDWQDLQVVTEAYVKWQERLRNWPRIELEPRLSDSPPQYLGNGRVWDGRSADAFDRQRDIDAEGQRAAIAQMITRLALTEDEIEEASTPRKRDIVDRMAAKRDSWDRQRDIDAEGQRAAITQMITRLALTEDEVEKASKAAKREEGEKYDDGA
jgi:hypothetical protein